ncbi:Alpha/Beta hydrolase protein [Phascolomyces articulosus]|uniref:Protein phosphatase methylesterase 1 n=1 Tax=Phascolomyces articulosus TaxID=60185 RepID=A0AAD5P8S5_9FUNG|nr:Alpha/Beta hydrolase protein [Phascolomyces articulosus]
MSALQKELFKKTAPSELDPINNESIIEEEGEENDSVPELTGGASAASLSLKLPTRIKKDRYAPVSWDTYFEEYQDIAIPNTSNTFRVYRIDAQPPNQSHPVFVLHHGAGHSGLSFAMTAHAIKVQTEGQCSIIALDSRGHGDTHTSNDEDYSLETMSNDLVNVIQQLYKEEKPDLILVGHSMGGSVVVDVASKKCLSNVVGVCVLDVVEGSAMDALASMTTILSTRPQQFKSVEQAIQWSQKSGTVHNLKSARVSVPTLVRPIDNDSSTLVWRTDLIKTKPYWTEWFENLSSKFLSCPAAKLLILAGTDRLDKPLMIGQMQGKFQLHIIPEAGHFLQEDEPERTAQCLVEFWKRNKRLVLPPKVPLPNKK